ncbi:syntaxin-binding protein 5 isoform X2 [Phlebotomus papatasi]|uniref:syntaxin-binding protein 5 isoform X2 n=1 Tax=Phlebotomus papatasi TaxID=29031 RepID=UPI0024843CA4|nr:syntaxin-binding protein 5 isoform X2 [Phlebotomus papatasi]
MKKFTFKGVLDGFRSTVQQQSKPEQEIQESLRPEHFQMKRTFRHGFPHAPTSLAYDPVQKLLVIGDKTGALRLLGKPGVDVYVRHEGDSACAVTNIEFLVNEGAFVTSTADDSLHLWNFRQKSPQVVQSLKFQRERITCLHLPVASKWLYVGTEKGNIHVVHIESFALSGYVINWNKAIEIVRTTHPGSVVQLCDNPLDANKLLIAYESGLIVLWDMRGKFAELRWQSTEPLRSVSWHHEGKHIVSSHTDGSLCTWPLRATPKPQFHSYPHAKTTKEGKLESCKPIHKVELKTSKTGETFTIFSGGLSMEKGGKSPCITVLQGKATTVLEMEHPVVDFITICESPWASDMQEPYAIAVLLQNDLVLIDLLTPGFPCFESPYPMDLHESPVTCCTYLSDCPSDLVPAFYSVGRNPGCRRTGFSDREWPLSGGEWAPASCSYSEIIITGHQDGSIKFWDASAGTLQILYKLKTAKIFERPRTKSVDGSDEDPLAIQLITLCAESRRLCVAGASGHVILFKFRKMESTADILVLEIPITFENFEEGEGSPDYEFIPRPLPKQGESSDVERKNDGMLRVRQGPQRKPPGFQAQLVCLTPWTNSSHPGQITAVAINSNYGLMAYGNEYGLVIVDYVQKICLLNVASPDLYGAQDPYSRAPRSPKRVDPAGYRDEQTRSPSIDQLPDLSSSPQKTPSMMPSSLPLEGSQNSSRAPSPANEALEVGAVPIDESVTPEDVGKGGPDSGQQRRKSSSWKAFNIKRQLSKVDTKIRSTFGTSDPSGGGKRGSVFYCGATEGLPLSPVEISPDSDPKSTSTDTEQDKSDFVEQIESEIVQSLDEMTNQRSVDTVEKDVERHHEVLRTTSPCPGIAQSVPKSILQQTESNSMRDQKRVEFIEEPVQRITLVSPSEGARVSRPSDLPLFPDGGDLDRPIAPPRGKKKEKQRLLSVPNIKYIKPESSTQHFKDLRGRATANVGSRGHETGSASGSSFAGNLMRRFNKLDSSFSRSRSSSMSSLENISSEAVQCLAFADSYTKKSDPSTLQPTLWIGTSLGSVLTISITLPDTDNRKTNPVVVSILGGPIFRLKGAILSMSFLDYNGALVPYTYEAWKDEKQSEKRDNIVSFAGTPTKNPNRMSPTLSGNQDSFSDRQFIVITSEKQARVVALPSQNCVYRQQIADTDYVIKAEIISFKDSVCLVCYLSTGHLMAFSLPSLRPLMDVDFLPLADLSFQTKCKQGIVDPMLSIWGQQLIVHEDTNQISKAFCFSNKGHGLYLATPTELQKFTLCVDFCIQFTNEMMCELFQAHDMPEPPKESFFKGLFGGGSRSLDREELFGESSGKANRSVAKHIPGPSANLEALGARASTATSEISRAHQLAMERGEKLSQLEDRTERMANQAQEFSGTAHSLMLKYKDKKWYQL